MKTSDTFTAIGPELAQFRDKVSKVKNTTGVLVDDQFYAFAPLPEVLRTIKPALKACGLIVMQDTHSERGLAGAMTRVVETASGEWVETDWLLFPANDLTSSKAAVTSARRYSLLAILGLAPIDDDGVMATGRGILAAEAEARAAAVTEAIADTAATDTPAAPARTVTAYKMPKWKSTKIRDLITEKGLSRSQVLELLKKYSVTAIGSLNRDDSDDFVTVLTAYKPVRS